MRVLVTGASGFVGRHVLRQLVTLGHEVIALANRSFDALHDDSVHWIQVDLLIQSQIAPLMRRVRPQALIHLAWYTKHGVFWQAAENFDWCCATVKLLHEFHAAGGEKIVVAGSCAEYDLSHGAMLESSTPTNSNSVYGKSKDVTRHYLQQYCDMQGLDFVWARVFFPYGPGEPTTKLIPSVLHSLAQSRPVICSHGQQLRDFIHVSDVAAALIHLMSHKEASGLFNIGSGQKTKISDIVNMCVEAFNSPSKAQFGAIPVSANEPQMVVADIHKLQLTGWQPSVSLRSGIFNYAEFVRRSLAC